MPEYRIYRTYLVKTTALITADSPAHALELVNSPYCEEQFKDYDEDLQTTAVVDPETGHILVTQRHPA